jgi:acetyl esterase
MRVADADQARLDPQARALIERSVRSAGPALSSVGVDEARRLYRESRLALAPPPVAVREARDFSIAGRGFAIGARYYRPLGTKREEALPAVVYFHGGGWTCGDLDTHDSVCRGIAAHGYCAVVAVDYRMGPEHKFPAAVEDALTSLQWVAANASSFGVDPARLVVAGESAGGNLAAAAAIALRDSALRLAMQVLVYPVTDQAADTDSLGRFAQGYFLTRELLHWYQRNYLRDERDRTDWRASPLRAKDHSRLPPAYIITAGFDPLRDEGKAYAERLEQAGVDVTYECFEGQIHGFLPMAGVIAAAHHAHYRIGQMLRMRFGTFPIVRP